MAAGASDVAGVTLIVKVAPEPTLASQGVQFAEVALIKAIWYPPCQARKYRALPKSNWTSTSAPRARIGVKIGSAVD